MEKRLSDFFRVAGRRCASSAYTLSLPTLFHSVYMPESHASDSLITAYLSTRATLSQFSIDWRAACGTSWCVSWGSRQLGPRYFASEYFLMWWFSMYFSSANNVHICRASTVYHLSSPLQSISFGPYVPVFLSVLWDLRMLLQFPYSQHLVFWVWVYWFGASGLCPLLLENLELFL